MSRAEMYGRTKLIRINGQAFRVPEDELTDPHADSPSGGCGAEEPYGGAVCTLAPHPDGDMHIAHDGDCNVIAMWGIPAQITEDEYDSPGRAQERRRF